MKEYKVIANIDMLARDRVSTIKETFSNRLELEVMANSHSDAIKEALRYCKNNENDVIEKTGFPTGTHYTRSDFWDVSISSCKSDGDEFAPHVKSVVSK